MTPEERATHQAAITSAIAAGNVELDDALDTIEAYAKNAKYQEAHIAARMLVVQTLLTTPYEDPALTVVGPITAGAPEEQPRPLA